MTGAHGAPCSPTSRPASRPGALTAVIGPSGSGKTTLLELLAGGSRSRVALAMAIASAAGVLIADEPTSRLDRENAGRAIRVLRACAAAGHTVICAPTTQSWSP